MEVILNEIKYKCQYHFGANDSFIEKANTYTTCRFFKCSQKFVSITF